MFQDLAFANISPTQRVRGPQMQKPEMQQSFANILPQNTQKYPLGFGVCVDDSNCGEWVFQLL